MNHCLLIPLFISKSTGLTKSSVQDKRPESEKPEIMRLFDSS